MRFLDREKAIDQSQENLVLGKNMGKRFRPFGTDNNVIGPVVAENLIEKSVNALQETLYTSVGLKNLSEN